MTPTPAPAGPMIDIAGELEKIGNPFRFISIEQIGPAISKGVSLVIIIAGLLFLAWFIWGAFEWLTSGGQPESVKKAQARLTNAGVGLVLVLAAWAVFVIVHHLFGIPFWVGGGETGPQQYVSSCNQDQVDCCQVRGKTDCCLKHPEGIMGVVCVQQWNEGLCHIDFNCIPPAD